jgi:hypothetical protein
MTESKTEVNGVKYICKSDGTAMIKWITKAIAEELVIRGFIEMKGGRFFVQAIDRFVQCDVIELIIPNTVEKIEECCFHACKSICEAIFESNSRLKEIGAYAFSRCGILLKLSHCGRISISLS